MAAAPVKTPPVEEEDEFEEFAEEVPAPPSPPGPRPPKRGTSVTLAACRACHSANPPRPPGPHRGVAACWVGTCVRNRRDPWRKRLLIRVGVWLYAQDWNITTKEDASLWDDKWDTDEVKIPNSLDGHVDLLRPPSAAPPRTALIGLPFRFCAEVAHPT